MIGELCKLFGCLPHQILELHPYELGLSVLVYQAREEIAAGLLDKMAQSGTPVCPAIVIKGG